MPWSHCDIPFVLDTEDCPSCGITKTQWTVEFDRTRTFTIGKKKSSTLTIVVVDEDDQPQELSYKLELADGGLKEGTLDTDQGGVRLEKLALGTLRLSFPEHAAEDFTVPSRLDPFALKASGHTIRLVLLGILISTDEAEEEPEISFSTDEAEEEPEISFSTDEAEEEPEISFSTDEAEEEPEISFSTDEAEEEKSVWGRISAWGKKAASTIEATVHAITHPYETRLNMDGREEQVTGDAHMISNQDVVLEQLAHNGAYGRLDNTKLDAWGYWEKGAVTDPESGFRAVLYMPTDEALAGVTEKAQIIKAIHGGLPAPVLAFRGTHDDKHRGLSDDLNREGLGTYQFASNHYKILQMLDAADDKVIVTGHSLGGTLTQLCACEFAGRIVRVVTFQAPGVERHDLERFRQHSSRPPSTHHRVEGDLAHIIGEVVTDGEAYLFESVGIGHPLDHMDFPLSRLAAARGNMVPGVQGDDRLVRVKHMSSEEATGIGNLIADSVWKFLGGILLRDYTTWKLTAKRDVTMESYVKFWLKIREMAESEGEPLDKLLFTIAESKELIEVQKIKMRDNVTGLYGNESQ